ncbi:phosphoglycolate phosphatase-like HAD superfamily hydrolase [Lewinella aquimaris]|uniref:phosphoglycolate phosphatase n=1 Tax=Neolewinella aquimaris TaxID=1835722 RepID=A0A840EA21_9BACT|nr:HAD-IA family hydrolase [Neolewinella aquimaris]MBB4080227.1 phosphoglycolate phosphatase-like HAD superfamily hydrolase [Neolewinella aquimaris]
MNNLSFNQIRAVVFDFDGVILDSAGIKSEAFPALFSHRPEFAEQILQHHLENQGISRYTKFEWIYEHLFQESLCEAKSLELGAEFSKLVFDRVVQAPFVPGAPELLQKLQRHDIQSFVASGTPEDELQIIVNRRDIQDFFIGVEGSPKTKASIVQSIQREYGYSSDEMMFVGDAVTDYQAAVETGLFFVAVDTPDMHDFWKQGNVLAVQDLNVMVEALSPVNANSK